VRRLVAIVGSREVRPYGVREGKRQAPRPQVSENGDKLLKTYVLWRWSPETSVRAEPIAYFEW